MIRPNKNPEWFAFAPPGGEGGAVVCPFDISVASESETVSKATLLPGSVNSLLPSNMFDEFTFNPSEVIKIKARALSDGTKITNVSLIVSTTNAQIQQPTPFALPSVVDILVGVIVAGEPHRVISCGSIVLAGKEQFRIDKSPPAQPGELPYVPYYIWVVQ